MYNYLFFSVFFSSFLIYFFQLLFIYNKNEVDEVNHRTSHTGKQLEVEVHQYS